MFMPERIDHHGWQLALLALSIAEHRRSASACAAGMVLGLSTRAVARDRARDDHLSRARRRRDGAVLGRRRRRSASGCAPMPCRSAARPRSASWSSPRTTIGTPVCDALSPVWLSDALIGSALMFALAWLSPGGLEAPARRSRSVAGHHHRRLPRAHLAAMPAAARRRFARSRAAVAEPCQGSAAGLHARLAHRDADRRSAGHRRDRLGAARLAAAGATASLRRRVIGAAVPGIAASLLLLWQTRTGPAAQMMAVVGGAALIWILLPNALGQPRTLVGRVARRGLVVVIVGAGAIVPIVRRLHPGDAADRARQADRPGQPSVRIAVGASTRSRFSPRAW